MVNKEKTIKSFISGLELTGSVRTQIIWQHIASLKCYLTTNNVCRFLQIESGSATVTLSTARINEQLKNKTLSDLRQNGEQLYLGVFVTNIQSKGQTHSIPLFMSVITVSYLS